MTPPPQRSAIWVAGAAALSGLTTYAMLAVVARAVGTSAYDGFSFFWSSILVAAFGAFLPIEQVTTRRRIAETGHRVLTPALRYAVLVAVAAVVAMALVLSLTHLGRHLQTTQALAMFTLTIAGYALQFPARGVLAGSHRLGDYAAVVTLDSVGRVVAVGALYLAGVSSAGPYLLAVGAFATAAGLLGLVLARRTSPRRDPLTAQPATPAGMSAAPSAAMPVREVAADAAGLSVAMLLMQALLNSPVLISGAPESGVSSGEMLAVTSLARIPVFLMQAAQATYVSRLAAAHHDHDTRSARAILITVAAGVVGLGALTMLAAGLLGPLLVDRLFGDRFDVSRGTCLLAAAGVAAYLCASVANDLSVALGRHRRAALFWALGAAAAVVTGVLTTGTARSLLPLVVGSVVTGSLIVAAMAADRSREG